MLKYINDVNEIDTWMKSVIWIVFKVLDCLLLLDLNYTNCDLEIDILDYLLF
jgi:hypothetical protein